MSFALLMAVALAGDTGLVPDWCEEGADVRLSAADELWCDALPPNCPGLEAACAKLKAARANPQGGCNEEARKAPAEEPVTVKRPAPLPTLGELPAALGQGMGWGVLGVVLVMVVLGLLRRRGDVGEEEGGGAGIVGDETDAPQVGTLPEGGDWLDAARRAAAAGRVVEALLLARGAAVTALVERGVLSPDPGRTDRELVRGFGHEPGTQAGLRILVTAIERVRYAGGRVDRDTVERAIAAAARIVAGSAMLLLCLLPGRASASPADRDRLAALLGRHGLKTTQADVLEPGRGIQLWALDAWATREDMGHAIDAAKAGDTVFVFGRAASALLDAVDVNDGGAAVLPLRGAPRLGGRDLWPDLHLPTGARQLESIGAPLIRDAAGEVIAVELIVGQGVLVVVADDHLLDDASLLHNENVDTLLGVLALPEDATIVLVSPRVAEATAQDQVIQSGFGVAVLQLFLLWGLWGWSRGRQFAARRGLIEATPRDFTAHLHAVARFYRATRASHVGFAAVAQRALAQLRRLTAADDAHLADEIAIRLGEDPYFVQNLLNRAHAAVADPRGPSSDDEPWLTETLWTLVQRLQTHSTSPTSRASSRP